jgi:pimeloyl-ACP methyl ester carboxylesterase
MLPRIVFVHGSVSNGAMTWSGQRALTDRFDVEILNRPGFPPNPPVERVDFDEHAQLVVDELRYGDHLVGHSYGGVICLLAGAIASDRLRSLTVVEPPAAGVALDDPVVARFAAEGAEFWARTPKDDPEAFLRGFLHMVGSSYDPPSPLPPDIEQGARTLMIERGPWEAQIPLETLAAAPFPKLVVSGAHSRAFDAICDRLERDLHAERVVLSGYGHSVARHPDFNRVLADFVTRAEAGVAGSDPHGPI